MDGFLTALLFTLPGDMQPWNQSVCDNTQRLLASEAKQAISDAASGGLTRGDPQCWYPVRPATYPGSALRSVGRLGNRTGRWRTFTVPVPINREHGSIVAISSFERLSAKVYTRKTTTQMINCHLSIISSSVTLTLVSLAMNFEQAAHECTRCGCTRAPLHGTRTWYS